MWYSYASGSVTKNIHQPSHLFLYGRHFAFVLTKRLRFLTRNFTFFRMYHFICRHRNDGLYDFVLFVRCYKQEISERAVQHRKFWCFNVPVVYFNLLFLLLFGTFWRTLGTSRTPDQKFAKKDGPILRGKEQSFESNERANTPKSHPKNNP